LDLYQHEVPANDTNQKSRCDIRSAFSLTILQLYEPARATLRMNAA